MERSLVLHELHQVSSLALVRRDDADLLRFDARSQETGGDLLDV